MRCSSIFIPLVATLLLASCGEPAATTNNRASSQRTVSSTQSNVTSSSMAMSSAATAISDPLSVHVAVETIDASKESDDFPMYDVWFVLSGAVNQQIPALTHVPYQSFNLFDPADYKSKDTVALFTKYYAGRTQDIKLVRSGTQLQVFAREYSSEDGTGGGPEFSCAQDAKWKKMWSGTVKANVHFDTTGIELASDGPCLDID